MIDRSLYRRVLQGMPKEAFVPMTPEAAGAAAGGMPPVDPSMMAQGGMPPADPAMMVAGGMPPVDPAMMAAGGMPPMDPSMMAAGGMPPVDPAMMAAGGMPPMDPSMMAPPAPQAVTVSLDDLRAILSEAAGRGTPPAESAKVTNASLMEKLDEIAGLLAAIAGVPVGGPPAPSGPEDIMSVLQGAPQAPAPEAKLASTRQGISKLITRLREVRR